VSRALESPCKMLWPVTPAVIDPKLIAASAVVEICPTEATGMNTRLKNTKLDLGSENMHISKQF